MICNDDGGDDGDDDGDDDGNDDYDGDDGGDDDNDDNDDDDSGGSDDDHHVTATHQVPGWLLGAQHSPLYGRSLSCLLASLDPHSSPHHQTTQQS